MMGKDVKEHVAVDEFICAAEDIFPRYGEYIFAKEGEEKVTSRRLLFALRALKWGIICTMTKLSYVVARKPQEP